MPRTPALIMWSLMFFSCNEFSNRGIPCLKWNVEFTIASYTIWLHIYYYSKLFVWDSLCNEQGMKALPPWSYLLVLFLSWHFPVFEQRKKLLFIGQERLSKFLRKFWRLFNAIAISLRGERLQLNWWTFFRRYFLESRYDRNLYVILVHFYLRKHSRFHCEIVWFSHITISCLSRKLLQTDSLLPPNFLLRLRLPEK